MGLPKAASRTRPSFPGWLIPAAFGCVAAVALLFNLGGGSLVNSDDPIYASIAREAITSGEYLDFTYQGGRLFEKPPVLFWGIATGYATFGIGDLAARLPAALAGICLLLLVYWVVLSAAVGTEQNRQNRWREHLPGNPADHIGALFAGLLLLSSDLFYFNARRVMTDIPFLLFTLGCFACLAAVAGGIQRGRTKLVLAAAAGTLAGLAVMTKSMAFGPPAAAIVLWFVITRQYRSWGKGEIAAFCVSGLVVAGWWHGYQVMRHGEEFLGAYLGYHVAARMTSALTGQTGPGFYLELLLEREGWLCTLLYGTGLLCGPVMAWRTRRPLDVLLAVFGLLYGGLIVVMQTRLPHYVLPLLVVGTFFVGRLAGLLMARATNKALQLAVILVLVLGSGILFSVHNGYHLMSGEYSEGHKLLAPQLARQEAATVAFNDYNVATGWYADREVHLWSTDEKLCQVMAGTDMLVRTNYFWCPGTSRAIVERLRLERPLLVTRRGQEEAVQLLLLDSGLQSHYALHRAGNMTAFFPH